MTAEQQQDGAVEEVRTFLDTLPPRIDIVADWTRNGVRTELTAEALRAVLAEHTALAARVAELEAVWSVQQDIIEIERRRTEKAEARLAELGEPEVEQRIIGVSGRVYTPTEFDLPHQADWLPGVRLEERQVYPTPWRVAPDAAQDGLSATETDADGVQASREGSNSSATAAELSGVEADDDVFLVGHTYRSENGYFEFHCERRIGDIALGIETVLKEWPVQPGQRFRRWASIGPEGCYSDVTNDDTTEDDRG